MTRLEDLQPTAAVRGILPDQVVTVVSVQWFGSEALELTYKGPSGRVANELLYRHDIPTAQDAGYESLRIGSFFCDWRVCWLGRWSKHRVYYIVMVSHTSLGGSVLRPTTNRL